MYCKKCCHWLRHLFSSLARWLIFGSTLTSSSLGICDDYDIRVKSCHITWHQHESVETYWADTCTLTTTSTVPCGEDVKVWGAAPVAPLPIHGWMRIKGVLVGKGIRPSRDPVTSRRRVVGRLHLPILEGKSDVGGTTMTTMTPGPGRSSPKPFFSSLSPILPAHPPAIMTRRNNRPRVRKSLRRNKQRDEQVPVEESQTRQSK